MLIIIVGLAGLSITGFLAYVFFFAPECCVSPEDTKPNQGDNDVVVLEPSTVDTDAHPPDSALRKGPPPMGLAAWGSVSSSFEVARSAANLSFASLPTHLPAGLELRSVRTNISQDAKYLSVFYTPEGVTANDNDYFENIMASGGMLILYSQQRLGPTYDQGTWIENFIDEGSGSRHLGTINGRTAIISDGSISQTYRTSHVTILHNHAENQVEDMVELVSTKYNSTELVEIAESLL
jgi:hypothetical protein